MDTVFLVCAVVGGTVLAIQFILTLIGLGGESFDVDGDAGADAGVDVDTGLDADAADVAHHGSEWVFGVLSFRTVVAALTFFGLVGLTARAYKLPDHWVLILATAAAIGAMYGVYWLMRAMWGLKEEGTVRIEGAVGRTATVYVPIPANRAGCGKIQINLQDRTMDYAAMTPGDALPTGAKVVVTEVITSDTLEVEPEMMPERIQQDV